MNSEQQTDNKEEETTCCFLKMCPFLPRCRNQQKIEEKKPILTNGQPKRSYGEPGNSGTISPLHGYPNGPEDNSGTISPLDGCPNGQEPKPDKPERNTLKEHGSQEEVEEIEMKPLQIKKVDAIFKEFQDTFNSFSTCRSTMLNAVKEFKTAVKTTGEFSDYLKEFKHQLQGKEVVVKKLVLKVPKAILKNADSVGSAATALEEILKAYRDIEKLPVKVTTKGIECVKDVMQLDPAEIVGEEFSGSVFDLGKIPKQMTNMHDNLKEIKKAPGIVRSFFRDSTAIVMDIVDVFGDRKSHEELKKKTHKVSKELDKNEDENKKLEKPEPPKEISFTSLKIPTVDQIFGDIAKIINPVAKLSKDLYDARDKLEKAMKAISEFREDETKAFNDYLDELKKRVKKGDIHISVSIRGNHVEVDKVEGLEPNVMKDIQSGIKGVIKSGNEIEDLGPDTVKELIKLVDDVSKISTSEIKSHVSFMEIISTISAFNENSRKVKKIPRIVKFFLSFIRNLLMDILDVLPTENTGE